MKTVCHFFQSMCWGDTWPAGGGAICESIMNESVVHTVSRDIRTAAEWHDTLSQMSSSSCLDTD